MREQNCRNCVHGKVELSTVDFFCKDCILGSEFRNSSTPQRVLDFREGVGDVRVINKTNILHGGYVKSAKEKFFYS